MNRAVLPVIALLALGGALIFSGYYPAMLVDGKIVSKNSIDAEVMVEQNASDKLGEAYKQLYEGRDLIVEVANARIEDVLVLKELGEQFKPEILKELQNSRLEEISSGNLEEASRELYGISLDKLKADFLLPIVRRNILENQMILNGADFNSWLAEAKTKADVRLFISGLRWNSEEGRIERK